MQSPDEPRLQPRRRARRLGCLPCPVLLQARRIFAEHFFRLNAQLHFTARLRQRCSFPCGVLCDATVRVDTRKNYRLLGVFTLCYGYILAVLSVYQYSKGSIIVAVAVAITFVLAFLLMLFAFQTKRDFLRGNKPFWPVEFLQGSVFCSFQQLRHGCSFSRSVVCSLKKYTTGTWFGAGRSSWPWCSLCGSTTQRSFQVTFNLIC